MCYKRAYACIFLPCSLYLITVLVMMVAVLVVVAVALMIVAKKGDKTAMIVLVDWRLQKAQIGGANCGVLEVEVEVCLKRWKRAVKRRKCILLVRRKNSCVTLTLVVLQAFLMNRR